MIKNMRQIILIFALIILGVSSCKYEKLLKSTDYKDKYNKAMAYYNEGDYDKAVDILRKSFCLSPFYKCPDLLDLQ